MMGNCTPRKPEVRLPHTLSRVSRGLAFCGHLPQLPSLLCPPSWPPRARTKPSGSDWEGNRRRDRGMGKAAQRNSSHHHPDCQLERVKKPTSSPASSLAPILPPWLCSGHRASPGLPRGPTLLPVGGNSDTCLTSEAEPGTARGRRQTTRRGTGRQSCSSLAH